MMRKGTYKKMKKPIKMPQLKNHFSCDAKITYCHMNIDDDTFHPYRNTQKSAT